MKRLIFSIALMTTSFVVSAQTVVTKGADGNYFILAKEDMARSYEPNGLFLTDSKGKKLIVYATKKGKEFVFATSKKSGREYRKYITLDK